MQRGQSDRQEEGESGRYKEREADTGRRNIGKSERGDMTYEQTVGTLIELNRGASEKQGFNFRKPKAAVSKQNESSNQDLLVK